VTNLLHENRKVCEVGGLLTLAPALRLNNIFKEIINIRLQLAVVSKPMVLYTVANRN